MAADGGIFSFGDAQFYGSLGGSGKQILGIMVEPQMSGYTLIETDGVADTISAWTTPTPQPTTTTTQPPAPTSRRQLQPRPGLQHHHNHDNPFIIRLLVATCW